MRIVIFVDYSHSEFNKDFMLSNALLDVGHQVFLVSNIQQLNEYINSDMDKLIRGFSAKNVDLPGDYMDASGHEIREVVESI